mmetsp:Transcript_30577/g.93470  ORF Transcript_30577/g.93470 Transcript_30577/m.93470 type:complete len:168 (-) Transcript_30577:175-678(-)
MMAEFKPSVVRPTIECVLQALPAAAYKGPTATETSVEHSFGNGDRYEGWVSRATGKMSGRGRYVWKDGSELDCVFRDGKAHGTGRLSLATGVLYSGEFRGNAFNGRGTLKTADGAVFKGLFRDGQAKRGNVTLPSGQHYDHDDDDDDGTDETKGDDRAPPSPPADSS